MRPPRDHLFCTQLTTPLPDLLIHPHPAADGAYSRPSCKKGDAGQASGAAQGAPPSSWARQLQGPQDIDKTPLQPKALRHRRTPTTCWAARRQCARGGTAPSTRRRRSSVMCAPATTAGTKKERKKEIGELARLRRSIGHSTPRGGQKQTHVTGGRVRRKPHFIITIRARGPTQGIQGHTGGRRGGRGREGVQKATQGRGGRQDVQREGGLNTATGRIRHSRQERRHQRRRPTAEPQGLRARGNRVQ